MLDPEALAGKPVLIAATGGSARHSLVLDYALRPLFAYLRASLVPTAVFAATADFGADESGRSLTDRVDRAGRELGAILTAGTWDASTPTVADAGDCGSQAAAAGPGRRSVRATGAVRAVARPALRSPVATRRRPVPGGRSRRGTRAPRLLPVIIRINSSREYG